VTAVDDQRRPTSAARLMPTSSGQLGILYLLTQGAMPGISEWRVEVDAGEMLYIAAAPNGVCRCLAFRRPRSEGWPHVDNRSALYSVVRPLLSEALLFQVQSTSLCCPSMRFLVFLLFFFPVADAAGVQGVRAPPFDYGALV